MKGSWYLFNFTGMIRKVYAMSPSEATILAQAEQIKDGMQHTAYTFTRLL